MLDERTLVNFIPCRLTRFRCTTQKLWRASLKGFKLKSKIQKHRWITVKYVLETRLFSRRLELAVSRQIVQCRFSDCRMSAIVVCERPCLTTRNQNATSLWLVKEAREKSNVYSCTDKIRANRSALPEKECNSTTFSCADFEKERFIRFISRTSTVFLFGKNHRRTLVWWFPFHFRFVRPLHSAHWFVELFLHDSFGYRIRVIRIVVRKIAFSFSSFSSSIVPVRNVYNFLQYFNKHNHRRTC